MRSSKIAPRAQEVLNVEGVVSGRTRVIARAAVGYARNVHGFGGSPARGRWKPHRSADDPATQILPSTSQSGRPPAAALSFCGRCALRYGARRRLAAISATCSNFPVGRADLIGPTRVRPRIEAAARSPRRRSPGSREGGVRVACRVRRHGGPFLTAGVRSSSTRPPRVALTMSSRIESDGLGELHSFCPTCWDREFGAGQLD